MIPGLKEASYVQGKIRQAGIKDVQLFWDKQIGIWVVCQVMKRGGLLLPKNYAEDGVKPHIMFYIKDNEGRFRIPSDQDVIDIIAIVQRSETSFKQGGDWMADKLDEQSAQKDKRHRADFKKKIKDIAPEMKKAVRRELS